MADYAQNTVLEVSDSGGSTFTAVAEVLDISGPSFSRDVIDTTSHDVTDNTRTKMAGLLDPGEITFDIQYMLGNATHAAGANGLTTLALNGSIRNWRLIPPSGGRRWNFAGFVSGFEASFPVGDKQTASLTVTVTAKPTESANP